MLTIQESLALCPTAGLKPAGKRAASAQQDDAPASGDGSQQPHGVSAAAAAAPAASGGAGGEAAGIAAGCGNELAFLSAEIALEACHTGPGGVEVHSGEAPGPEGDASAGMAVPARDEPGGAPITDRTGIVEVHAHSGSAALATGSGAVSDVIAAVAGGTSVGKACEVCSSSRAVAAATNEMGDCFTDHEEVGENIFLC